MSPSPTSIREGKAWLAPHITALQPASILDVGCGEGTYATLLRPQLPDTKFIGLEVWEPYLTDYNLADIYDMVIVADIRHTGVGSAVLPPVDVVILGDVLEHMTHDEALSVWARCRRLARLAVFASIPIIHAPQGAVNGNVHETHVHTWTHELGLQLPGVTDSWVGGTIGCYQAGPA